MTIKGWVPPSKYARKLRENMKIIKIEILKINFQLIFSITFCKSFCKALSSTLMMLILQDLQGDGKGSMRMIHILSPVPTNAKVRQHLRKNCNREDVYVEGKFTPRLLDPLANINIFPSAPSK